MIRTVQTEMITETIKKMCIEANYSLSSDMVKANAKSRGKRGVRAWKTNSGTASG